jgi:guanidinoacetate N-methyltransferase
MFERDSHPLAKLAFPASPEEWQGSPAHVTEEGLKILGHPVMQRWETPYMAALARIAASAGGRVLEVGFGLGLSASFIQAHRVREHWIVEANREVFETAQRWAASSRGDIECIYGFWEAVVPGMPDASFDGILFDPYPITLDQLHTQRFAFFAHAHRLLRPGGVFTHYSGEVEFTPQYQRKLRAAGFVDFDGAKIAVEPPAGCEYWDEDHILAPVIRKIAS